MPSLSPSQPRSIVIEPFLGSGEAMRSLWVEKDSRLPPVLGRVLAVHKTVRSTKPGDVVVFRQYTYEQSPWTEGDACILWERSICAVLEGYPG